MSVTRIIGATIATALAAVTVSGIALLIARDFGELGATVSAGLRYFESSREERPGKIENIMKRYDGITFFKHVPIAGTSHKVTTGIAYASADDVVNHKTKNRWCYLADQQGKLTKQIDLGKQAGNGKPVYSDLTRIPESEFKALGLSAVKLASLARSHCFLQGFDPKKTKVSDAETKAKRKSKTKAKVKARMRKRPPAHVWQLPRIWRSQRAGKTPRQI